MKHIEKRNVILDYAKFFMSIYIMLGHYSYFIGKEYSGMKIKWNVLNYLPLASVVGVFFVISGFLSIVSYREQDVVSFMKKKILRLYPLMFVSIVEFCIISIIYYLLKGHFYAKLNFGLGEVIVNSLGINMWVGTGRRVNGVIWYVSVLMFCYLVFVLVKNSKIDQRIAFPLLAIAGLMFTNYGKGYAILSENVTYGVFAFFCGACIYLLLDKWNNATKKLAFLIGISWLITMLIAQYSKSNLLGNQKVTAVLVYGLILIVFSENLKCDKEPIIKLGKYLGSLSFGIYLLHIPTYIFLSLLFADSFKIVSYQMAPIIVIIVTVHAAIMDWILKKHKTSMKL